ncbi:PREDICTED: non-specific lipid-transfer protein 1-like [Nicotiana attenuata]|uniref:Non-specific lipid-transfer protein n=1 Tax=Nicotiana attenuata TaxID=49451 RepID=A0A1J6KL57_NICAT|nr:PREDICTED: non-specific lipid-transfer protein 1-like [Nicotiana attenuata]OIT22519.1 non-specific lipid-transfer protein 12 [Nicotiana attenuata]
MARFLVFLALALVVTALSNDALGAPPSCQTVTTQLAPCLSYIQRSAKGGDNPSVPCCTGIDNIYQLAKTKEDRVAICNCLKTAFIHAGNVNPTLVAELPKKCGISFNMPPIDKNYDCNTISMY